MFSVFLLTAQAASPALFLFVSGTYPGPTIGERFFPAKDMINCPLTPIFGRLKLKTMSALNLYLAFNGNCETAFQYYKKVFGGEFITHMTFGETPGGSPVPEASKDLLMHVSLPVKGNVLMGCDMPLSMPPATFGNNFNISVNADTTEEADKIFNGLSKGGTVTMPMQKTFWSPYFGMLTDQFGIQWMVGLPA